MLEENSVESHNSLLLQVSRWRSTGYASDFIVCCTYIWFRFPIGGLAYTRHKFPVMLRLHYGLPGLRGLLGTVGGFKPRILVGVAWSKRWRELSPSYVSRWRSSNPSYFYVSYTYTRLRLPFGKLAFRS